METGPCRNHSAMIETKSCRDCGEALPLTSYRKNRHGNLRPSCRSCEQADKRARKGEDPERLAMHAERQRQQQADKAAAAEALRAEREVATATRRAEREAAKAEAAATKLTLLTEADRERAATREAGRQRAAELAAKAAAVATSLKAEASAVERRLEASGITAIKDRSDREEALRHALWDTMRAARELREARVATPEPTASNRLKLKDGKGFISIGEFALRVAERDACHRAGKARKLLPAASRIIALLERDTDGPERRRAMHSCAKTARKDRATTQAPERPTKVAEVDPEEPFGDAFGDWAPAWMRTAHGSWTACTVD